MEDLFPVFVGAAIATVPIVAGQALTGWHATRSWRRQERIRQVDVESDAIAEFMAATGALLAATESLHDAIARGEPDDWTEVNPAAIEFYRHQFLAFIRVTDPGIQTMLTDHEEAMQQVMTAGSGRDRTELVAAWGRVTDLNDRITRAAHSARKAALGRALGHEG